MPPKQRNPKCHGCLYCNKEFTQRGIIGHLKFCRPRETVNDHDAALRTALEDQSISPELPNNMDLSEDETISNDPASSQSSGCTFELLDTNSDHLDMRAMFQLQLEWKTTVHTNQPIEVHIISLYTQTTAAYPRSASVTLHHLSDTTCDPPHQFHLRPHFSTLFQ
jgi:hypothetical protein